MDKSEKRLNFIFCTCKITKLLEGMKPINHRREAEVLEYSSFISLIYKGSSKTQTDIEDFDVYE